MLEALFLEAVEFFLDTAAALFLMKSVKKMGKINFKEFCIGVLLFFIMLTLHEIKLISYKYEYFRMITKFETTAHQFKNLLLCIMKFSDFMIF